MTKWQCMKCLDILEYDDDGGRASRPICGGCCTVRKLVDQPIQPPRVLVAASINRPQPCDHCGAAYTPHTDDCPVSPRAPGPMQPHATPAPPPAAPAPVIAPPPPAPSPWPPGWAGTAPRPHSTGGFTSGGPFYYGASGPPSPARQHAPGFNPSRPFDRRAVGEAVVDLLTALTKDGSIPGFATTDQFDELVSDIIETIRSGT